VKEKGIALYEIKKYERHWTARSVIKQRPNDAEAWKSKGSQGRSGTAAQRQRSVCQGKRPRAG
jgi:hypothetical protein